MVTISDVDRIGRWGTISASEELVLKNDVFDLKCSTFGLAVTVCKKRSSCPLLVYLYTCLGLHRYNFLKGTKFVASRVNKYIQTTHAAASTYYITLDAKEPASSSPPQATTTFQIKVSEESRGEFVLGCSIARIRGETSYDRETTSVYIPGKSYLLGKHLPEWPPENPFENEKYCLVNELELQEIDKDWIHLYLELAVATADRYGRKKPKDYDDLQIVDNVLAIDGEGLYAKNATFYIRFKDMFRARLGQSDYVDRVAIIRRRFDEDTGDFSLEGQILSSQVIPNKL